jgi:hypothetical protein
MHFPQNAGKSDTLKMVSRWFHDAPTPRPYRSYDALPRRTRKPNLN